MNLNELSKQVAEQEGGKVQLNIAQIKEVIRIINEMIPNGIFKAIISCL